jgi:hypothetical protein
MAVKYLDALHEARDWLKTLDEPSFRTSAIADLTGCSRPMARKVALSLSDEGRIRESSQGTWLIIDDDTRKRLLAKLADTDRVAAVCGDLRTRGCEPVPDDNRPGWLSMSVDDLHLLLDLADELDNLKRDLGRIAAA